MKLTWGDKEITDDMIVEVSIDPSNKYTSIASDQKFNVVTIKVDDDFYINSRLARMIEKHSPRKADMIRSMIKRKNPLKKILPRYVK